MLMNRTSLVAAIASLSLTGVARSQSPMALRNVGGDAPNAAAGKAVGANNPWFGSQVGYRFGESDEFSSNLLIAGQLVYPINLGASKVKLPVIGNIGGAFAEGKVATEGAQKSEKLEKLLQSNTGATIGVYPYRAIELSSILVLTVHAQASWKGNMLKTRADSTKSELVSQAKFGAGLEMLLGDRSNNSAPLSLSVTPTWLSFSRDQMKRVVGLDEPSISGVESVLILPLRTGLGVVFESVIASKSKPALRIGIVLAKE